MKNLLIFSLILCFNQFIGSGFCISPTDTNSANQAGQTSYLLARSTIGSGGVLGAASNNFRHHATAGQTFVGRMQGTNHIMLVGFWTAGLMQTDVEKTPASETPTCFKIYQNYPNPFNPSTTIRYDLPEESEVSLKIYSLLGEEVAILYYDRAAPGNYKVKWQPAHLASGVYLCRLTARSSTGSQTFSEVKKLIYVR